MKAKDLMIGDWIRLRYTDYLTREEVVKEFQVGQLRYLSWDGRGETMYVGDDHQNMSTIDKMEPIPLTPEILEKNGFGYIEKAFELTHFYLGEKHFCKNMDLHVGTDNKGNFWINTASNTIYGLHYVHEFQHALRLCGIEKEIEL